MSIYYPHCVARLTVVLDKSDGDTSAYQLPLNPRKASVHLNSYKEADTFDLECDAKEFPMSPEMLRGALVEIWLFQTDQLNYDPALYVTDNNAETNDTRVIVGLVDNASYEADAESGGSTVHFMGRDLTSLLIDKKWPLSKLNTNGQTLQTIIQEMVDIGTGLKKVDSKGKITPGTQNITTNGINVKAQMKVVIVGDDMNPILSDVDKGLIATSTKPKPVKSTAKNPRRAKKPPIRVPVSNKGYQKLNSKGIPVKKGESFWDAIVLLCAHHGLIATVRGYNVIISTPQNLTYNPNDLESEHAYFMVYGNNLAKYKVERKLGKESVPQIKVFGYDPIKKQNFNVIWPDDRTLQVNGTAIKRNEVKEIARHDVADKETALAIAQAYWYSLSRSEGKIHLETKDLKDWRDGQTGNDLLKLRNSYPVFIKFDDLYHEQFRNLTTQQRYDRMRQKGYSAKVSEAVSEQWEDINAHNLPFYTKEVVFTWETTSGINIEIIGLNFIKADVVSNELPNSGDFPSLSIG